MCDVINLFSDSAEPANPPRPMLCSLAMATVLDALEIAHRAEGGDAYWQVAGHLVVGNFAIVDHTLAGAD